MLLGRLLEVFNLVGWGFVRRGLGNQREERKGKGIFGKGRAGERREGS